MTRTGCRSCFLNVGHCETGSTTLAKVAEMVGCSVHRMRLNCDDDNSEARELLLANPRQAVWTWWENRNGKQELKQLVQAFDFISNGYIPWLLLLADEILEAFCLEMKEKGVAIHFLATTNDKDTLVVPEAHHELEIKAVNGSSVRTKLPVDTLLIRDQVHLLQQSRPAHTVTVLALEEIDRWPLQLEQLYWRSKGCGNDMSHAAWRHALFQVPVPEDNLRQSWFDCKCTSSVQSQQYAMKDIQPLKHEDHTHYSDDIDMRLDVVIPTYRLDMPYLERICQLTVPARVRTTFIVSVDNPSKLMTMFGSATRNSAALELERHLKVCSGNSVCVLCNPVNAGASAARNRGLDESAAEYVLFLDDDIIPDKSLLFEYEKYIRNLDPSIIGLVGNVQFPRRKDLPVLHAAVLMSYLTSLFEIASNSMHKSPDWGVAANLLVRNGSTRFDTAYDAGGGEDVDFCLRLTKTTGGRFLAATNAKVTHDYWPGGLSKLLPHIFRWGLGDGALFMSFPSYCYRSWPNVVEYFVILCLPVWLALWLLGLVPFVSMLSLVVALYSTDVAGEICHQKKYKNRCALVHCGNHKFPSWYFWVSHCVANGYVVVFECGRLVGNWKRNELFNNTCKRFKWHCRELPDMSRDVVRCERFKFACFVLVSLYNTYLFYHKFG